MSISDAYLRKISKPPKKIQAKYEIDVQKEGEF